MDWANQALTIGKAGSVPAGATLVPSVSPAAAIPPPINGVASSSWSDQIRKPLTPRQRYNINAGVNSGQLITPPLTNWFQNLAIPVGHGMSDVGQALGNVLSLPFGKYGTKFRKQLNAQAQNNEQVMEPFQNAHPAAAAFARPFGQFAASFPLAEGAGSVVKALATPLVGASAPLVAKIAGRVLPTSTVGAAYGAQTPGNQGLNTLAGALLGPFIEGGAKLGGAGLGVAMDAAKGIGKTISRMTYPEENAAKTVADIINTSRTGVSGASPPALGHLPINLSLGGETTDPGLQSLEQTVRSRSAQGMSNEAAFAAQQRANNDVLVNEFDKLHSPQATFDSVGNAGKEALSNANKELKLNESALWQVPEIQNTNVNIPNVWNAARDFYNELPVATQDALGKDGVAPLNQLATVQTRHGIQSPFSEIHSIVSNLGDAARAAAPTLKRALNGMKQAILNAVGNGQGFNASETAAGQAYRQAAQHTWNIHNLFFPESDANGVNVLKWLKTDPSKLMNQVTSSPANLDAYLRAASQAPDKGAQALQAVRDHLVLTAKDASSGSARGGNTPFILGQKLKGWIADKLPVLSKVFSPSEVSALSDIGEGAYRNTASEAASPRVGSNTVAKYLGNKAINRAAQIGEMGGVTGKAVGLVRDSLLGKYHGETERLLRDSLLNVNDPEITTLLSSPSTPANMAKASKMLGRIIKNRYVAFAAKRAPLIFGLQPLNPLSPRSSPPT